MHSIQRLTEKIKGLTQGKVSRLPSLSDDLFLGFIIILVAFGSFGLGRLSKIEGAKTPIRIENSPEISADTFNNSREAMIQGNNQIASILNTQDTQLVASKSGKKYYYPWCTGVQKIAEKNRIYFASKTEAEARGYTPSATCKGL